MLIYFSTSCGLSGLVDSTSERGHGIERTHVRFFIILHIIIFEFHDTYLISVFADFNIDDTDRHTTNSTSTLPFCRLKKINIWFSQESNLGPPSV